MTGSISSKTGRVQEKIGRAPEKTPKKSKGGNRARPRPAEKVLNGRVNKRHQKASSSRISMSEVAEPTENVQRKPDDELSIHEAIGSGVDDAYEDAGTDRDCSEASGSATEKDTPTRLALERRKEAKKKSRAKITLRRLDSPRGSVRTAPYTPSTHRSSSVARSSPCVGRASAVDGRSSSSTRHNSLAPIDDRPPRSDEGSDDEGTDSGDGSTVGPDGERVRGRGCNVSGGERILLDVARLNILDYTLFRNPFPSAQELTSVIHLAWGASQEFHEFRVEPSGESLYQVSMEKALNV